MTPQILLLPGHAATGTCMTTATSAAGPVTVCLRGTILRHVLLALLDEADGPLTTTALTGRVHALGFSFADRASRAVPDALRTECARRRVVRVDRATWAIGSLPRVTRHRVHWRLRHLRRDVDAAVRALPPAIHGPLRVLEPATR